MYSDIEAKRERARGMERMTHKGKIPERRITKLKEKRLSQRQHRVGLLAGSGASYRG